MNFFKTGSDFVSFLCIIADDGKVVACSVSVDDDDDDDNDDDDDDTDAKLLPIKYSYY